jgi:heat shock protein HtpX
MPSIRSLGLRARLAALVALLIAFDAVFVVVAYWFAHLAAGLGMWAFSYELNGLVVDALQFRALPSPAVVAVGTALTLAVQSVFGYRMSANTVPGEEQSFGDLFEPVTDRYEVGSGAEPGQPFGGLLADRSHTVSEESDDDERDPRVVPTFDFSQYRERVEARLTGLAQLSDTPVPDVRIVDSETPNSYVAGRPGQQTLVVTTGLLRTLDDEALDAVLAHELAHLKNGDAFVMTAAGFLPTVTARVNDATIRFLRVSGLGFLPGVDQSEDNNFAGAGQLHFAMLALSPIALVLSSLLWFASTVCYRSLSRIREFHADAGAVAIEGSPASVAGALETLADHRPETDLRAARTGVRELCVLPDAIHDEDDLADDRVADLRRRWRSLAGRLLPASHPSVERRVAALRERERSPPER